MNLTSSAVVIPTADAIVSNALPLRRTTEQITNNPKYANMKKLFRTWLRERIYLYAGDNGGKINDIFDWIYASPITTWRLKLKCLAMCRDKSLITLTSTYGWIKCKVSKYNE